MQVSIIIVNYNTEKLLQKCLHSIFTYCKDIFFEVIVIDNGSTDTSINMMNTEFPQVKIVQNEDNVGFGKANNQGVKIAKGKWLLFLNSDTVFIDNVIESIFSKLEKFNRTEEEKTVIGCSLLNSDKTIQPSTGYFPTLGRVFCQMLFIDDLPLIKSIYKPYQQSNLSFYTNDHQVDWVTGAFLFVSKSAFQEVNGFDESIFMYGEEVDLCYRMKRKGVNVCYLAKSQIIHHKGASSSNGFRSAVYGEYKGLVKFYQKYYKNQVNYLKLILFIGALLRIVLFGMINVQKAKTYSWVLGQINKL